MNRISAVLVLSCGVACASDAVEPPEGALWNTDRSAAAISSPAPEGSRVFAYLRQKDGAFLKVDVSQVEDGNFGKLGHKRNAYERFETKPLQWSARPDGVLQLTIQTQAWKSGKRYTVSEPLLVQPDGKVLWR